MEQATPLIVPQVNVNDDTVLLARWAVADGAAVTAVDVVCDVETTKAASEIVAGAAGVLVQSAAAGSQVRVGAIIGAIAATREAAVRFLSARAEVHRSADGSGATPKAIALAAHHGVSLDEVRAAGAKGTIKEADVQRFVAASATALPAGLARYMEREGELPAFDAAVAANLRRSTRRLPMSGRSRRTGGWASGRLG